MQWSFPRKEQRKKSIVLVFLKIVKKTSKKPIPRFFFLTEWLKPTELEHSDRGMV